MDAMLDNWEAQIRRGWLEVAILASLWPGQLYGLEIIRALAENSDLVVAEGTVYPVLARLLKAELVDAEWIESNSGHPRKYYKLTALGRKTTLVLARNSNVFLRKMLALVEPLLKENKR
jgi:PadR family transcriptional regulator, regulatory protein PadR